MSFFNYNIQLHTYLKILIKIISNRIKGENSIIYNNYIYSLQENEY